MTEFRCSNHCHNLAEGIIWDHHVELLLFVDILSMKLFRMHPNSFEIVDEYSFDEYVCWVQLTNNDNLYLLGMQSGLAIFNIHTSEIKYINKEIPQEPSQRLNDSFVDFRGRVWFGSMEYKSADIFSGVLASYSSKDRKIIIQDDAYGITNGPIINHRDTHLFHTDSLKGVVYKFSLHSQGTELTDKTVFLKFDPKFGVPDGMCFDKEGNIYVAIWGGWCINKYNSMGELMHSYKLPDKFVTNISFAGNNLDKIFVTTAIQGDDDSTQSQLKSGYIYEILNHNCQGVLMNEYLI
ncbi:hypothetical protein CL619_04435 [archaeon]|nr:hypothetical protein [archaeon]|tara:strand:- start:1179 stop:2060 length:882 start_codon:yes stop_codon:yes gene_type:complete